MLFIQTKRTSIIPILISLEMDDLIKSTLEPPLMKVCNNKANISENCMAFTLFLEQSSLINSAINVAIKMANSDLSF